MNVFQFYNLIQKLAKSSKKNNDFYHEIFVKVSTNNLLLVNADCAVKCEKLSKERLVDYLDFLEIFEQGIDSYELVCDDVYRILLPESGKSILLKKHLKAS